MSNRLHRRLWHNAVQATAIRPVSDVRVLEGVRECPGCGLFQRVPRLAPGRVAYCGRCGGQLARRRRTPPLATPTAFCVASIALYLAMLVTTLLTINVYGRIQTITLFTGPIELLHQGYGEAGILVGLVTIVTPGIVLALMSAILWGASRPHMPDWAPRLMTWYERLRGWSMIEVYILGVFVAYSKLIDLALVDLQAGVYLIAGLMFTMAAIDSTLDPERIWQNRDVDETINLRGHQLSVERVNVLTCDMPPMQNMVSCSSCHLVMALPRVVPREADLGDCPRCGQHVRRRRPQSLSSTTAFLLAGLICYLPANLLPVMTYTRVGRGDPSTIINGVIELWQAGLVPLALLVLFASITVPVLKIVSLSVMIVSTYFGSRRRLPLLTKLYRVVDLIGRWSMIDVFMISILVAVVRFGFLANVTADFGMVCFAAVVILTIFAAECFDPRGMWDAAGLNGPVEGPLEGKIRPYRPDERRSDQSSDGGRPQDPNSGNMEPARA
ncbi:paraquat-inducible protein A [Tanticharoenia sakaeratensis]|nr:paraquat-inducible protein A [Tanticharoenia sakaeratensis]